MVTLETNPTPGHTHLGLIQHLVSSFSNGLKCILLGHGMFVEILVKKLHILTLQLSYV